MLTFEQIKDLIDQVARCGLSGIELERSGFRLKIDGHKPAGAEAGHPVQAPAPPVQGSAASAASGAPPGPIAAPAALPPAAQPPASAPTEAESPAQDLHILNSPIVGTFYRSPSPDSPPFAEVGDRVESGQILCIVEAMKLMNEIESDAKGTIAEVYVKNAQPVEYGEPLFAIKTS